MVILIIAAVVLLIVFYLYHLDNIKNITTLSDELDRLLKQRNAIVDKIKKYRCFESDEMVLIWRGF